ncbi:alpha/beta hydrolase [Rohdeia mirabilis]|uniref:alpha/beta hydrolase n=1 Tax=Rohdeia mirabilis TaxID=2528008 RepID=UPI003AF3B9CE
MRGIAVRLILLVGLVHGGLCVLVFAVQDDLLFHPGPPPRTTPAAAGLTFEDVWLDVAEGERVHGWWIPPIGPASAAPRGAVVYCHGNAGSIGERIWVAQDLAQRGLAVLLFDYRGFGSSDGRPSESALRVDARAAYDHVREVRGFAPERIVVHGRSLGGAVAARLAAENEVAGLVLESTFTRLADAAGHHYPWLPVGLLLRHEFDTRAAVAAFDRPLLVLHGRDDGIVPFDLGRRVFEGAGGPKRFVELDGGHNGPGFRATPAASAAYDAFLVEALER